jgi:hypothetical protein
MTAHPERERDVAGDHAANRKPLGEPLEHRAHDEAQRLQKLDAVFELDGLDEQLGAAAGRKRRVDSAAREADQLDAVVAEGGCFVLTMHPFLSGRPSRAAALDELLARMQDTDGLWIATLDEIARHAEGLDLPAVIHEQPVVG